VNDRVLHESISTITRHARKMDELLRDGKIRELEIVLGAVHQASTKGVYRCLDLAYQKQPETEMAGT
jgi:hypothetical protein